MRKFLLFVFALFYYQCWGQGNMITINSTVPGQMTVCGASKTFTIAIYNPSPFLLTNDTLKLTMPPGIAYQSGSITGATEFNISIPNQPVFLLPDIPTLTSLNITFTAAAICDVMAFLSGGGIIENKIRINYLANGTSNYDEHTTSSYIVRQPNLSISNFTNQSYTGAIGDTYTRCITVTNGGFGELSQFTLSDVHGSGIQITAVSTGAWVNTGNTETITLGAAQFSAIGDGDNLFENGESIIICETVYVNNCISVASAIEAWWGCNSLHCQSSVSNANVVFPNLIPNLVFTPIPFMNTCIGPGNASLQQLKIINTGLGKAVNVQLDIFQTGGAGSGYQANIGSYIDTGSFTIQTGLSGIPSDITPISTYATATLACMTNPQGRVLLTIPFINSGDTLYLKWNSYSCCYDGCANIGSVDINGWRYKGSYENICQSTYVITETWGRQYSRLRAGLSNNGSPSTLTENDTGTFNFLFTYYENTGSYPVGPGAYWKFEFTLPPCLTYAGGLQILRSNGINTWNPSSVTTSGSVITAVFNGVAPWSLLQAQVMLNLVVNCSGCGGTSTGTVSVKAYYIPNNTCSCEIVPSCQSTSINVLCPGPCPEGMLFKKFTMLRTSYGLPDNQASGGDGLPDGAGSLDFTKIKTDRAMFGDTVTCSFNGIVKTSLTYPVWQYCYAFSSIANGNRLTFVDARLTIYRAGALIATCTSFTPTITNSGTTRTFKYDLSVATLGACLPGGFVYSNDDSVVFKPRYRVSSNIGGATPLSSYSTNEYYVSDIPNPTLSANKFQCSAYNGNCTIIGYYYTNYGPDSYSVKSCNNVTISQNYYLSIGPCCSNYAGGNLFPYEYRNWAHIKTLTTVIPSGYDFVSAQFNQVRTAGTLLTNTSSWVPLTPLNPNSDTLQFPVEQYFQGYGGTIPLSDDGFYGTLQAIVRPSCEVTPSITKAIRHNWEFTPTSYLTGTGSAATTSSVFQDSIVYEAPFLFLQSTLPSINAPDMLASWDISVSNLSNSSNALNTWLSGPVMSGITITQIYDLDNNVDILPVGDIYQIGTVNAAAMRNFRITASFTSCLKDSVIVYSGWNCNAGYPTSVQTYPCTPKSIKLSLSPLMPALVVNITAPPGTIELCDTASYIAEGVNVQLGTAYNVSLIAVLPQGVSIVPGTSQMSYPVSNPYVIISDPVFMGGTTWKWDVSVTDSTIGADGLKGILLPSLNTFRLTFKVVTTCGYTSGSTIAFNLQGEAACGMPTGQEVALSSQLGITGATPPYLTSIHLFTTYISPCADNSALRVAIRNLGPDPFGTTDSIFIQLPVGVTYVSGTFSGIHNPPSNGIPVQSILNGSQYLGWKLPSGVVAGDSTIFDFDYKGDPQVLTCAISNFEAHSTSSTNVLCAQSGTNCGINIATGDTTLPVFTYKAYLSLGNGHATSVPNPPSGETVTVSLDITNTGQAILTGANSILQFYYDSNGNGVYNTGDVFIIQDTLLITNNSTVNYTNTFNVPAGNACSIIATVRNVVNPCVCNPSQLLLTPIFKPLGPDSTVCSGSTLVIGPSAISGYTYSWSPTTGLSSAVVSNAALTASNTGISPITTPYIVTVSRMGCTSKDTIAITVNPLPVSNAGADITVCPTISLGTLGTSATAGYSYSWSPSTGLSSTSVSDPAVDQSPSGTISYTVTTTALGCSTQDSVVVKINPLPTATIYGSTAICKDDTPPSITFTGANGTAPYTFTYTINGGANQTVITTSGNSVNISVPTTTADTLIYELVSVQESSTTICSQSQSGSAMIIVNPLPIATITGSTEVCEGSVFPDITFTGANGTAPYTFTYSINGGTNQTITTSTADSITIAVPTTTPGTDVYTLISVQDGSSTACAQNQNGTATVIVNPSPTATISSSTTAVCKDATFPSVTFAGVGGTAPYIFTYNINGGTNQTVATTNGNLGASISVPTTTADTLVYTLVSIQDASSTACSQNINTAATVIVKPLPTAIISGASTVCKDDTSPNITFTGADGIAPYTFTYTINNGPQLQATTNNGDTVEIAVPTATAGTYTYTLVNVKESSSLACSQNTGGAVMVTVNPLPTASITGSTTICQNDSSPLITFTGVGGTAPYTFTYTINSSPNQIVTTTAGDTVSVAAPTATAGAITYVLVSVQDSSPSVCSQNQNGSATVIIKPLPTAVVSGTTAVCKNATPPIITFTGAGGTPPYIFTYAIDTVTQPPVTSSGNNATVAIPTAVVGSFTYNLVNVQESSANQCSQAQTGSATITVNPLPTATVTGTAPVCKNDDSPYITFTGADGISPYIFTYTINGGINQTVGTTIGSTSTTVAVPTTSVDTLIYKLISVQEGSITTCSQLQGDSTIAVINPLPVADYSPTEVCLYDSTLFNNLSTVSTGIVAAWNWNFGDNNTSNQQNPLYAYAGFGNYTATLIVTTDNGCKDTASKTITVHPLPSPGFYAASVCEGTNTAFSNLSTIPTTDTIQSWSWDFADNNYSTQQQPTHLYDSAGVYTVELTALSTFGCIDSTTRLVRVHSMPDVKFSANDTIGCELLCVYLLDVSQIQNGTNALWFWDAGDGSPSGSGSEFQHCYTNSLVSSPVSYNVTLTVTSDSGCTSILTKTNYITVYPKPEADFAAQPMVTTILNPVIALSDSSLGAAAWSWNFGDQSIASVYNPPSHEYTDTGHYTIELLVTSLYGCVDTAYETVIIEPDFAFYVPNAFTPNDDGVNDTFTGKGVFIMEYEMIIYDRWGNMIYYTDNINKPWDGKANYGDEMAQRDVYIYVIKVTDIKSNKHKYRGTVTLVK